MTKLKLPDDLAVVELEFRNGELYMDGKSCRDYALATDAEIARLGFNAPQAVIMLVEYLGSQIAAQDHLHSLQSEEVSTFYLELVSKMLGVFYNNFRARAMLSCMTPEDKKDIN